MDKREAEQIVVHVMDIYAAIGKMDAIVSGIDDREERRRIASAMGAVLEATRKDILLPLFDLYPELKRPDYPARTE